jgi:hypothetical protein
VLAREDGDAAAVEHIEDERDLERVARAERAAERLGRPREEVLVGPATGRQLRLGQADRR